MASTFTVSPAALHELDHDSEQRDPSSLAVYDHPIDANHLSPLLSQANADCSSPSGNLAETPSASTSGVSHYQASDFSELDEDPFFGANFNNVGVRGPSFLNDTADWDTEGFALNDDFTANTRELGGPARNDSGSSYPLTPEQTASIHTVSPRSDDRAAVTPSIQERLPTSISPQELQKPFRTAQLAAESSQLTPSQSSSCRSSEDGLAPTSITSNMQPQSPRVTVSVWDKQGNSSGQAIERSFDASPRTIKGGASSAGDLIAPKGEFDRTPTNMDDLDDYVQPSRSGFDPHNRPSEEISSMKELAAQREVEERNRGVGMWLKDNLDDLSAPRENPAEEIREIDEPGHESTDNIPLGDNTENRPIPGQTYYTGNGGQMSQEDYDIIASNERWADAPVLPAIRSGARHQPQSSQAAIERFEKMCRDNDSVFSRAATWGTRRRSLHSVADFEVEGVTSGNFLKKLSISRGNDKPTKTGSLLKDLAGLVRRPSASFKRQRSASNAARGHRPSEDSGQGEGRRESGPNLAPPSRETSWSRKSGGIGDAIMSVSSNAASVAAGHHARSGSISAGTPLSSPRSPRASLSLNLNSIRRPRSRSELPKSNMKDKETPSLVDLLRKSGGPPVPSLSKTHTEPDEDEDEDEDMYDVGEMNTDANLIDGVTPNFAGFQEHINVLNPTLDGNHGYLVDRIAHQQIVRYKHLLNLRVRHLTAGAHCPSGGLCLAMGGSAKILDPKGEPRAVDSLPHLDDDEDGGANEGAISQESFPPDIPMPPTQSLPAEFECQLCFAGKKFQKPSDWTKHVHEDVQPFTCTWDKCRDAKIFKRKADWVRHENEGHRHLEWWTCDVDDCRHTCYRRDNFLQHLVREHKFLEPKQKTKAAIKRAGGGDLTWQKVEACHIETSKRPQEEPCRFCGKTFPTWKKLTVHLAKHMEQISLPVLRLVAVKAKELAADTIISPVQDPPPRRMMPPAMNPNQTPMAQQGPYADQGAYMYMATPTQAHQFQPQPQAYYQPHFDGLDRSMHHDHMGQHMPQMYGQTRQMQDMPVTTGPYALASNAYLAMPGANNLEPFPDMNALGLQNMDSAMLGTHLGAQMGYEGMMTAPGSGDASPFSGQGSASPYNRSPHQQGGVHDGRWQ